MSEPQVGDLVLGAARGLGRALDAALVAAGGSTSTWHVLRAVRTTEARSQAELAATVGVRQPTLTHHLDGLERSGLVTRWRDPDNRRVQRVLLTPAGEELFVRLRRAAAAFEGRLTAGLEDGDVRTLRRLLALLVENSAE
ncbi:MarR family winged helix-turn-helix transcriptional regulator [Trujillonella endophytica]|uniref:MarR family transcriptional regulator, transcriptional regulator for hemolysin n=1 Tax=Trujillonella endophytica TaxID=673521 RepID=A0A1H8P7Q2_9ACTN|nr:MarR family transcriptional regulator [Trujillella endophytica]SEO37980.1 MarR family transcriptional regulator, transcriptional regulator for hemolysin [Trujillella endophytica]